MNFKMTLMAGLAMSAIAGSAALGDAHADKAALAAVKARQATMQLYAFNIGQLGAMAKGDMEYDAEAASAAADNLVALSSMNQMAVWAPGTDNETLGDATRALPAIWADDSDIGAHVQELRDAAAAMSEAAGEGLDSLRGAMGPLGNACGGCHEDYRQSDS